MPSTEPAQKHLFPQKQSPSQHHLPSKQAKTVPMTDPPMDDDKEEYEEEYEDEYEDDVDLSVGFNLIHIITLDDAERLEDLSIVLQRLLLVMHITKQPEALTRFILEHVKRTSCTSGTWTTPSPRSSSSCRTPSSCSSS